MHYKNNAVSLPAFLCSRGCVLVERYTQQESMTTSVQFTDDHEVTLKYGNVVKNDLEKLTVKRVILGCKCCTHISTLVCICGL